jgi:hypothetical protein
MREGTRQVGNKNEMLLSVNSAVEEPDTSCCILKYPGLMLSSISIIGGALGVKFGHTASVQRIASLFIFIGIVGFVYAVESERPFFRQSRERLSEPLLGG